MWSSLVKIQYKELKLSCGNDPVVKNYIYSNGDLDLWPNDPKINRALPTDCNIFKSSSCNGSPRTWILSRLCIKANFSSSFCLITSVNVTMLKKGFQWSRKREPFALHSGEALTGGNWQKPPTDNTEMFPKGFFECFIWHSFPWIYVNSLWATMEISSITTSCRLSNFVLMVFNILSPKGTSGIFIFLLIENAEWIV